MDFCSNFHFSTKIFSILAPNPDSGSKCWFWLQILNIRPETACFKGLPLVTSVIMTRFLGENPLKNGFQLCSNMMFVGYPPTLWGLGNDSRTFRKVFFDLSGSSVSALVDLDARGRDRVVTGSQPNKISDTSSWNTTMSFRFTFWGDFALRFARKK